MDIITLEHVTKSFDGQKILEDFNLSVREGEFLTVIGRSGCGKTTMLKLMNGLLTPDRGKVYVAVSYTHLFSYPVLSKLNPIGISR